jgi:hypothetical protein
MFNFVYDLKSYLERPLRENAFCDRNLGFIGRFKNGNPDGDFWLRMIGGGFVTGNFATQDAMAFIYPGVIFINIFLEPFSYKSALRSFFQMIVCIS